MELVEPVLHVPQSAQEIEARPECVYDFLCVPSAGSQSCIAMQFRPENVTELSEPAVFTSVTAVLDVVLSESNMRMVPAPSDIFFAVQVTV